MHTEGKRLRDLRELHGLTQAGLAERIGEHVSWISNRERDVVGLAADDVRRVKLALGLTDAQAAYLAWGVTPSGVADAG